MINQLNALINGVESSEGLSDNDRAELIAEARVLRAFNYFQLAMEFQHTYSFDPSLPAPPIYTELSLEGKPMITDETQDIDFFYTDSLPLTPPPYPEWIQDALENNTHMLRYIL